MRVSVRPVALVLAALLAREPAGDGAEAIAAGFESISEADARAHLAALAAPELEGRDSPSEGLTRAAAYIAERLKAAGVEGASSDKGYLMGFTMHEQAPVPDQCALALLPKAGASVPFVFEQDFVPLPRCAGKASGKPLFLGFGITESEERYDDLKGKRCEGAIAVVLEGEPRHKKLFRGPEVTRAADVYAKVDALEKRGAAAVLVVRRSPEKPSLGPDGKPLAPAALGYRYTWADWNPDLTPPMTGSSRENFRIPALEISEAAATTILGTDVAALAAEIEKTGKPVRHEPEGVELALEAALVEQDVPVYNVVGILRGKDPALAGEALVIGAHYDHIGVDVWGRIGNGADDNGSGTAGLIELAEAFALSRPARSIVFAFFGAEEDGLIGSQAFCRNPPVPLASVVAMLNMDMIGIGTADQLIVLGLNENPGFEAVLKEAKKLKNCQIKKVITDQEQQLWERSDHYSFHEKGIPSLFFFEGKESENPDYHTYRDSIERLSFDKITRTTRFVFNTAWLIANDPARPVAPR